MKMLTRPGDSVIFFIALVGVLLATSVLFLLPASSGGESDRADSAQQLRGADSRPASQPATRAASRPVNRAAHDPTDFPVQKYNALLDSYLKSGLVDYQALSTEGKAALDELVQTIADTDAEKLHALRDAEYMAWYINAYNILTLQVIAGHYPVKSIMDIDKPWDTPLAVAREELTLNDIEHNLLRLRDEPEAKRRAFVDPRVHFALNCASTGCPELLADPFTAEKLNEMLDDGVRRFVQNPSKFRIEGNTLQLSQLLDWYGDDFKLLYEPGIEAKNAIGRFFAGYVDDGQAGERLRSGNFKIEWLEYDWSLNEAKA